MEEVVKRRVAQLREQLNRATNRVEYNHIKNELNNLLLDWAVLKKSN